MGRDDPYVRHRRVELAEARMVGEYQVLELDAGHWLIQESYGQYL